MPDIFRPADLKTAAERLNAAADKLAAAGVDVHCDIADMGLALVAVGDGRTSAEPSEVVPLAHVFIHAKDELDAAADRLIAKVQAGRNQAAA